jgi:asparagine synthase (glutamine-hydrolysing)
LDTGQLIWQQERNNVAPIILGAIDTTARQERSALMDKLGRMMTALKFSPHAMQSAMQNQRGAGVFITGEKSAELPRIDNVAIENASLAFVGTLYNRAAILAALQLTSRDAATDAQIARCAIESWGMAKALMELSGRFSLAYWDARTNTLALACDGSSEMHLYYAKVGTHFLFSSDFRAFKAFHKVFSVDREALGTLVQYGALVAPQTIYREVREVPTMHYVTFTPGSADAIAIREQRYAQSMYGRTQSQHFSDEDATNRLESLLLDGIKARMNGGSVGAFMSSGYDSTLVAAMLKKITGEPIPTFTAGFHGIHFDEAPGARAIAQHLGTDHHEIYIDDSMLAKAVQDIPNTYSQPFADSSQLPTMIMAKQAKGVVDTVFAGDGADCILGAYVTYIRLFRNLMRAQASAPEFRQSICSMLGALEHLDPTIGIASATQLAEHLGVDDPGRDMLQDVITFLRSHSLADAQAVINTRVADASTYVKGTSRVDIGWQKGVMTGRSTATIDQIVALDSDLLLPAVVRKTVSACDQVSLNVAMPFMDKNLLNFCGALPRRLKFRGTTQKWLIRQVAHRYIPKALLDQPKHGFSIWLSPLLRNELRDWAENLLDAKRLESDGFFHHERVRKDWHDHLDDMGDFREERLWSVLMFQQWMDASSSD